MIWVYFKELACAIVGLARVKLVGGAGRLGTRARCACYNLEAEWLLQEMAGFAVKASSDWMMQSPCY